MLLFIGLGLWDEKDISVKGLEEAKNCDILYAEFYTSKMGVDTKKLEKQLGKKIIVLDRENAEKGDKIINDAKNKKVGFLVAGDPMTATTHISLRIKAIEEGIKTKIIHGASIITASAGLLGLQIYKFGRIVSIARPYKDYFPLSPYDSIKSNMKMGLHTLLLLDTEDHMTANEGMQILLEMEKRKKEGIISEDTLIAVVARASSDDAVARAGYLKDLIKEDFGETPHSIVIPAKLHFMEAKALVTIANAPKEILREEGRLEG